MAQKMARGTFRSCLAALYCVRIALIAGVGLLVMIAMLTSCAGIWLEGLTNHKGL